MRVYSFEADEPVVRSEDNLVSELVYNKNGQKVTEEFYTVMTQYFYEREGGPLIKEIHNCPNGARWTLVYTYDLDGNLVYRHWTGEGDYFLIPTDLYADEWCDWSNEGKVCTWKKETLYRDGRVRRETTREEYNKRGLLRLVHHYNQESDYDSLERFYYNSAGELTRKSAWTVFETIDGERRAFRSRERHVNERKVCESTSGIVEEGEVFHCNFIYEYEDDEEGNWIVSREISDGKVLFTIIREIEYW